MKDVLSEAKERHKSRRSFFIGISTLAITASLLSYGYSRLDQSTIPYPISHPVQYLNCEFNAFKTTLNQITSNYKLAIYFTWPMLRKRCQTGK